MKQGRPSVNRRDLIRGLRGRDDGPVPAPSLVGRLDLLKASRPAMGSHFEVRLPASTPDAAELATDALDVVDILESQLTVYRDDSEVSRLNANAHRGPVAVEAGLFDLLKNATEISRATGGAYDVTAGALSAAWGFVRGPKRIPEPSELLDALGRTGWRHLIFDVANQSVAFDLPGVMINLGSIGKGYAIDRAVDVFRGHFWPTPALIHGGQSSVYALGSPPSNFGGRWEISLRNPFDPARSLGTIRIRNRAIGTSGAAFQRFEVGKRVYGHLIDPRTGYPPEDGPASVTVLAPSAAEADALSTAFYLLGPEGSREYVQGHDEIGALFVMAGPDDGRPRVLGLNVNDDDFQPARFARSRSIPSAP